MSKTFLILGGAGYIGSHMVAMLCKQRQHVIVIDNLSTGDRARLPEEVVFNHADFSDPKVLRRIFSRYKIACVMHFAAFTMVDESVQKPEKYYHNNLIKSIHLLDQLCALQCKHLVFSSTAAVYGKVGHAPVEETHIIAPKTPYGQSKAMFEAILADYAKKKSIHYTILRYFNACGLGDVPNFHGFPKQVAHLIPSVIKVATKERPLFHLYGDQYPTHDGTCVRDFIHVNDICSAHLAAFYYMQKGGTESVFNIGTGTGFSVKEIIKTVEKISGNSIPCQVDPPRDGDLACVVASSRKISELCGWRPQLSTLKSIIESVLIIESQARALGTQ
jgi:UDP-glucose 4-epimerase